MTVAHDGTMTEDNGEDVSMLVAENKALRSNLLALKRMLLVGVGGGEKGTEEADSGEPPLRRRRVAEEGVGGEGEGERKEECSECQRLQNALNNTLDQYRTAMTENDTLKKDLSAIKTEIEKLKQENFWLRRSAEERHAQKLIAVAAAKKNKDTERRYRQKFVSSY